MRIGVVGLGMGMVHVRAIEAHPEKVKLTAVCDLSRERLERAPAHVRKFTDFDTFLREAELDAVVLAVPHILHAPQAIRALQAGKHVLVEKPMARNSSECEAMIEAADKAGLTLMVAQNWRYTRWCVGIRRVLGEIGEVRAVKTEWVQNIDMHSGRWLKDGEIAGGGPVISLMVHNLDYLRYLLGEVDEVYAATYIGDPGFVNGAESWAMAQLRFKNGALGQMFTSYAAFCPTDAGRIYLYGNKGTIHTRPHDHAFKEWGPWIASESRGSDKYEALDLNAVAGDLLPNPQENQILHFAECCEKGAEPISGAKDNIRTIRLIEAIYKSAREGRPVAVQH